MTPLTQAERRLGWFVWCLALLNAAIAAGLLGAVEPPPLGIPGRLALVWCAVMVGIDPRRHRPYLLPVAVALLSSAPLCLWHELPGWLTLDVSLGLVAVAMHEGARRSVNGAFLRGGPPIG